MNVCVCEFNEHTFVCAGRLAVVFISVVQYSVDIWPILLANLLVVVSFFFRSDEKLRLIKLCVRLFFGVPFFQISH